MNHLRKYYSSCILLIEFLSAFSCLFAQSSESNTLYHDIYQEAIKAINVFPRKNINRVPHISKSVQLGYRIQPLLIKNHIVLSVDMTFQTVSDTNTIVGFFPQASWNQHSSLVQSIQTYTSSVSIEHIPNTLYWNIRHKKRSPVHLHYFVIQDSITLENQNLTQPFPAILGTNYFLLENASLLALPTKWLTTDSDVYKKRQIIIQWQTDSAWQYANSFGINKPNQRLTISAKDLLRSMTVGSRNKDKCTLSANSLGTAQTLFVATTGVFAQKNAVFAETIKNIASAYLQFWHDSSEFSLIAAVAPVGMDKQDEETGVIGFAISRAFVGFLSDKRESINFSYKYLFAHEMLHKWINGECFPLQDFSGFGYCAAEGFTDYIARYILLQNGMITQAEYLHDINTQIQAYLQSPFQNMNADSIKKNFWSSFQIMKIPYRRGDILAHIWANEIRKHTNNKHDFATALRDIIQQYSGTVIIDQIFAKALETYIGRNVMDDILKYMKNGETIPIPPDMMPFARLSAKQTLTDVPQFEIFSESK